MLKKILLMIGIFFVLIFTLIVIFYKIFLSSPSSFIPDTIINIETGKNINQIFSLLEEKNIIRDKRIAKVILYLKQDKIIPAGYYHFPKRISVIEVVDRLRHGDYGQEKKRVTIPEGLNVRQIVEILAHNLDNFSKEEFISLTEGKEGFLFPDTYFFFPQATSEDIIKAMEDNFERQTIELKEETLRQGKNWREIVIIASLIELEASQAEARRMISDIIWRRLKINMPLQIDAVFPYIMGKNTFELTLEDLQYDSPYNTYRYRGLPPGAIANPSLDSLEATLYPIPNEYWYYLSDKEGNMHYTITHDEHLKNKQKYLR
ncbi:MAG TPA: endolytic transglycosylase MltG [Candidatus Vogelbacteria bacterium]|nr:endolytic transglycosylase MltG [Candidatus Vogelbacteria bacterium]